MPTLQTGVQLPDGAVAKVHSEIARLGIAEQFPKVVALTRELFGDFTVSMFDDPEIHDCVYVTFKVRCGDSPDAAFAKESEWIRRLPRCPSQATGSFCLDIDFTE